MTPRSEVYKAIDSERDYQKQKWGENPHTLTEWLVYIRDYTEEAMHTVTRDYDDVANPKALDTIRKIGGMAVACMEQHGAPLRQISELDPIA